MRLPVTAWKDTRVPVPHHAREPERCAPLLVLGNRTFSEEVADVAAGAGFAVAGYVENLDRSRCEDRLRGLPIHWVDELGALASSHRVIGGLSTTRRHRFAEQAAAQGMSFATVVHPTAHVSASSLVGEGALVSIGAIVGAHTSIGAHAVINRGALVGHHTEIGPYASIQPGANVAGACRIGEHAYIGIGAIVIDHVSVGRGSIVGAGAVVLDDVPDHVLVVGVPARIVRHDVESK